MELELEEEIRHTVRRTVWDRVDNGQSGEIHGAGKSMKAAVIEGPGILVVRDISEPEPGDYQVKCKLLYGAVCAGTDNHVVAGHAPFCKWFQPPAVLGHESIGRVVKMGSRVKYFKEGDLVTRVGTIPFGGINVAWGGFAQYGIATDWQAMKEDGKPDDQWSRFRVNRVLPAGSDPAAATMIITWRETLSYLTRMGMRAGANVLVIGSGGNGLAFAAHARNMGAANVAVLGSPTRKREVETVGAFFADYHSEKAADALKGACAAGFDLVVDAVGKAGGLNPVLHLLKQGAIVAVYGLDDATKFSMNPLCSSATFTFYRGGYDEAETHESVIKYWREGKLNAKVFLTNYDSPFTLDQINEALAAVRDRKMVKALVRLES